MSLQPARLRLVVYALVLGFGVEVVRLAQVQLFQHQLWLAEAERQQGTLVPVDSPRGTIRTREGLLLAGSVEKVAVYVNPKRLPRDKWSWAAEQLAPIVGQSPQDILEQIQRRPGFFYLARGLDPQVAERVARLHLRGVGTLPAEQRVYPMGTFAAPVLGFVNVEGQGQGGIEAACNQLLAGEPALVRLSRDGKRIPTKLGQRTEKPGRPGFHVVLTLDARVQWILEEELSRTLGQVRGKGGSAVALNATTGEILGLASLPAFDPQQLARYPREHWRNRAVETVLEPGSTFKPFVVAAALQAGVVHPESLVDCSGGGVEVAGVFMRDHGRFGTLPLAQVLSFSSNAGAIRLALRTPGEVLDQTIRAFGFGQTTGVELPAESPGLYRPRGQGSWSALTPAGLALGQEISVTAVQLARAYAVFANGGLLVRPTLIRSVHDTQGQTVATHAPKPPQRVLPQEVAEAVSHMLEQVVEQGTGKAARVAGFRLAGKTGTAQKAVDGSYRHGRHAAWFAGFFPQLQPSLVLVVCVDEPEATFWASEVAAPAFGRMARRLLQLWGATPRVEGQA
ncbi:MAG: penicillin-binding protein 2 [Thermoanaerobaculum sp.]|nr:penicillin-binding protein 2 [Thermoanaerobaculum sp.]MDW7968247.1 penicillin-binding protein 2 [Thermoanaerobaculum sp.]